MTALSEAYDVVVIGAGAGGMTAAAVAAAEGLSVLLIEKTEFIGGTTAWSGGMVWIPVNAKMKQAGIDDSLSEAAAITLAAVILLPYGALSLLRRRRHAKCRQRSRRNADNPVHRKRRGMRRKI